MPPSQNTTDADVVVIGAGFSGSVSAYNLANQGIKTIVVEQSAVYPDAFRAEKLEPSQAAALRRLKMFDFREPSRPPLGTTINYRDGRSSGFDTIEQYGMHYGNTVNSFRKELDQNIELIIGKVSDIKLSDDIQTVITAGREIHCRLIVLASGGRDTLIKKAGISRRNCNTLHSLNFAFNIVPVDAEEFPFTGFNYFLSNPVQGVDYVTIFRIGDVMRVNVFTQWNVRSEKVKKLKTNTKQEMSSYFPDLIDQIGDYSVTTPVQTFPTSFYRLRDTEKSGIVVIGDDYQSVCPATGTGLDKVTTDVERLCHHYIPEWLKTDGMPAEKITQFYQDHAKKLCDNDSLERWIAYRDNHRGFLGRQASRIELKWKKALGHW